MRGVCEAALDVHADRIEVGIARALVHAQHVHNNAGHHSDLRTCRPLPPPPPPPPPISHQSYDRGDGRGGYDGGRAGEAAEDRQIREEAGGNFADFRRLKRTRMWERNAFNLWRNTPSPPPGSREEAEILKKWECLRGSCLQRRRSHANMVHA